MKNSSQHDSTWDVDLIEKTIKSLKDKPGALLPILHAIQSVCGYIPKDTISLIAKALNQTSAEIHGVISFYHYFRTSPSGNHSIQVCRGEACQARGSRALETYVKGKLKINYHEKTPDGEFDLTAVYCLGNCARGPSIRVGDDIIGSVDKNKFNQIINTLTTFVVELN
ncbi:MAG: formate dehydrogenase [Gammaproteobacteria bacterium]|nr:MAG: formate dehydrogenase [Gammaproteobacteria bacterium]PHR83588.1 MAG: formate dehydrogenase [Colwellia sp.]